MTTLTPESLRTTSTPHQKSHLIRAEWTKLRTVRSTWWTLSAMVLVTLGVASIAGASVSHSWTTFNVIQRATFDPTGISLKGLLFSQLIIGVLGVLVMSAEYGTGTIRSTLAATPQRTRVLIAKAGVVGALSLVVGEVLSFGAFFLGQSLLRSPAPHAQLSQPHVLQAVVGGGVVIGLLGLFALGIATLIRHSAGAITTYVGILLVVPIILQTLPSSFSQPILKFMPFHISDVMTSTVTVGQGSSLSPWVGAGVLALYAFGTLAVGGYLLRRRDA
ncbi:MAG: ABC transporter permease subunit [Acidimicrobiaceae bacterium]|nr:ABC transporter permease subunit [Acidimicrobiaceae bacterium]